MLEPRAAILHTPLGRHGGPDGEAEPGLDFSVNSNPYGPPAGLLAALREVDVSTYPDPTSRAARAHAAAHHGVGPERVLFGNGSADLIHRLCAAYLRPGDRVLVAGPTFGEYARAALLYGAQVLDVDTYTEREEPDPQPLLEVLETARPTLVWVCQPNNPTGQAWSVASLERLAAACEGTGALLVVDAAYLSMSEVETALPASAVELWSLTKLFCVPGLRVGYAVAPESVITALVHAAPPWQVSSHAQHAAVWSFSDEGRRFVQESVPRLLHERAEFQRGLRALGLTVLPTCTSFFLVGVESAAAFSRKARAARFRVRDGSSFGLPHHLRLATRTPEDNTELLGWLASC